MARDGRVRVGHRILEVSLSDRQTVSRAAGHTLIGCHRSDVISDGIIDKSDEPSEDA